MRELITDDHDDTGRAELANRPQQAEAPNTNPPRKTPHRNMCLADGRLVAFRHQRRDGGRLAPKRGGRGHDNVRRRGPEDDEV